MDDEAWKPTRPTDLERDHMPFTSKPLLPFLIAASCGLPVGGTAVASTVSASLVYEYDAAFGADDGNSVWEASISNPSYNRDWSMSGQTFLSNAGSSHAGITSAYAFSGSTSGGGTSSFGKSSLPLGGSTNAERASTAWEIWVRPGASAFDDIGNETLFETGGSNTGGHLAFVAADGGATLRFRTGVTSLGTPSESTLDHSITDDALLNDFIQIVGVVDPDSASQKMRLYVNGALVGSLGSYANWSNGNNAAGLGKVNGTFGGGFADSSGSFFGDIASLRLYDGALSDADVSNLYDDMAYGASNAVPGLGGLGTLSCLGLIGRRRRR